MSTAVRLTGYAVVLVLAFGSAWGVGTVTGPPASSSAAAAAASSRVANPSPADTDHADPHRASSAGQADHSPAAAAPVGVDGLAATAAGYTLVPEVTVIPPGTRSELAFAVTGSDGRPVTAFDVEHDERMEVIVVRRDAAGFQHLHPALGPDGTWRVPLVLPAAGVYRVYADFVPTGGPALVLGTDLFAAGDFSPIAFSSPSRVAQVDGYQVRLDGELVPGGASQVFATVSRDGAAVTDLQPYLGAFGHLVALRRSDLSYQHVRPDAAPPAPDARSGPGIAFTAEVPTAGGYRLFLDFRHGGVVRTAEFTVDTRDGA